MPNRLFMASDGVQWIVSVHGFVGEGAATSGEELPDYDLEGADQEQLEAMLDLAEPNRLRPEKD